MGSRDGAKDVLGGLTRWRVPVCVYLFCQFRNVGQQLVQLLRPLKEFSGHPLRRASCVPAGLACVAVNVLHLALHVPILDQWPMPVNRFRVTN